MMESEGTQQERGQSWVGPHQGTDPGTPRHSVTADLNAARGSDLAPALNEDQELALLERRDLTPEILELLSQKPAAIKSRKVCFALAAHPRTPRPLALRLLRRFYTFDLMQFSLEPTVAADLKGVANQHLVTRLAFTTVGECLTLARRASETVAAALLLDQESSVSIIALDSPRLTEAAIIKALTRPNASAALVEAVCHHPKWSLRREIRLALMRNPHTPLARALEFSRTLPSPLLRDILHTSRLPEKVKACLRKDFESRR